MFSFPLRKQAKFLPEIMVKQKKREGGSYYVNKSKNWREQGKETKKKENVFFYLLSW